MVWIAQFRRLVKQIARFPPCRADTFCAGVSNLAQNNEPARVIVSLAEMRIKKTSSRALRPSALSRTIRAWAERAKVDR